MTKSKLIWGGVNHRFWVIIVSFVHFIFSITFNRNYLNNLNSTSFMSFILTTTMPYTISLHFHSLTLLLLHLSHLIPIFNNHTQASSISFSLPYTKKKKKNWISVVRGGWLFGGAKYVRSQTQYTFWYYMRGVCSLIQFSFPLFILWKILHSSPLRCCVQTGHPALSMDTHRLDMLRTARYFPIICAILWYSRTFY